MEIKQAIEKTIRQTSLSESEAYATAGQIMEGKATDAQIAALLVSLRHKGESVEEITGFARAMRDRVTRVGTRPKVLVDTCGTGGDGSGSFNVSTVSAFVAAGAGCSVAKHGNRSISSRCGSADVFQALGVKVDLAPEAISRCIDETGIGFMFAPNLHPAMKHAIGPRREIGIRTVFNILGPLTNPAGAKRQLLGVYDGTLTDRLACVLKELGSEHVLVVHGEDGLDEITLTGQTKVTEMKNGEIFRYSIMPETFGFRRATSESLKGGEAGTNAAIARDVLNGKKGPVRDTVLLNAGAVIYVGGKAATLSEGVKKAEASIDSGKALNALEKLILESNR
jgi:anthranilate phosphoribosyltransferase